MKEVDATIEKIMELKLHEAELSEIEGRLDVALQNDTPFDQIYGFQLGESRVKKLFQEFENTLRRELCEDNKLKQKYASLLTSGKTANFLKSLATTVIALLDPRLAVSSVGVLIALWVFRIGLNQWCSCEENKGQKSF